MLKKRGLQIQFFPWVLLILLYLQPSNIWAQQKANGPPPASVTVTKVTNGMVAPQGEFIATVFYQEISDTAAEISGLVETVSFEDGQRVKHKQILVKLGSELLDKQIQATRLSYEQILSELEIARIDLNRREKLFKKQSISEQSYDENRFRVIGLEKRAASLKAEVELLEIERQKKTIVAPFDGVVIKRQVDRGEWLAEGETVAVIGKDDVVDIVAEVPERLIQFVQPGMRVRTTSNGQKFTATVIAIVPKADAATRTFPVKIRTANHFSLIEGMSAKVTLPTGIGKKTLIVPRDAVVSAFGKTAVFAVLDSKAIMMPVDIVGYNGLNAGVEAPDLKEGMLVALEGNERLRNGQAVVYGPIENTTQN